MKSQLRYGAMLTIVAFMFAGCSSLGANGSSVSLDQEWQLGDQMAAQVAQQVKLVHDPAALAYVRSVGEKIHQQTPLANRPFDFEIVNDPSVNAFSLPGGHIYVNTGLIAQADRVDMLAGVIAHEISHVVHRDAIKQLEQQQEINAVGSILLGQNPGVLAQLAAQIVAGGAMAKFSRQDEKSADDLGLELMTRAGYDPHGMVAMFQKLLALEQSDPNAVARFFADHPTAQSRIRDLQQKIAQMGNPTGIRNDPQYQVIRQRVMAG
ncbi:MAG: M48 family metallopeptidase [Thermoanaerobaculia bacterium]